jgi:hypothetical protein
VGGPYPAAGSHASIAILRPCTIARVATALNLDVAKAANTGRARLERQLALMEAKAAASFRAYVDTVRSKPVMDRLSEMLERGQFEAAYREVNRYVYRLSGFIPQVFAAVGTEEVAHLAMQLKTVAPTAGIGFDPSYPRASQVIRNERLAFVREFSESQRQAVRQAIDRGFQSGEGYAGVARRFRDSIGLTRHQEAAVFNYRTLLENGSREALTRDLRDRRFDAKVARAADEGGTLTNEEIDRMVERYRERYIQYRAESIGRTEGGRATSIAREEATAQAVDELEIGKDRIVREWIPVSDARTRDAHAAMAGQRVGMDEPFTDGDGNKLQFPRDPAAPPETTIGCRCSVAVIVKGPNEE